MTTRLAGIYDLIVSLWLLAFLLLNIPKFYIAPKLERSSDTVRSLWSRSSPMADAKSQIIAEVRVTGEGA